MVLKSFTENFNISVNAAVANANVDADADAGVSAIALLVLSYRRAKMLLIFKFAVLLFCMIRIFQLWYT